MHVKSCRRFIEREILFPRNIVGIKHEYKKAMKCDKILAKFAQFWWAFFVFVFFSFTVGCLGLCMSFCVICPAFVFYQNNFLCFVFVLLCPWLFENNNKGSSLMKELQFFTIMLLLMFILKCFIVMFKWVNKYYFYLTCLNLLTTVKKKNFGLPKIES